MTQLSITIKIDTELVSGQSTPTILEIASATFSFRC